MQRYRDLHGQSGPGAGRFGSREPLAERVIPPLGEEGLGYVKRFLSGKLGRLDEVALENALIVLGDGEAITRRKVGPATFRDLLADARSYYAIVHGYYDPKTSLLAYFAGRRPDDESLRHVRFDVDFDKSVMGERIIRVDFYDGPGAQSLRALEGLQVSGGFGSASVDDLRKGFRP